LSSEDAPGVAQVASWVAHDLANMLVLLEGALDGWRANDRGAIADLEGAVEALRQLGSRLECLTARRHWENEAIDLVALTREAAARTRGRFLLSCEVRSATPARGDAEALRVLVDLLMATAGTRGTGRLSTEGPQEPWILEVESAAHSSLRPIAMLLGGTIAARHGGVLEQVSTEPTTRWRLCLPASAA